MKKALVCLVLALALVVAGEAHIRTRIGEEIDHLWVRISQSGQHTETAPQAPSFSQQLGSEARETMLDVTLYFRFAGTDVLGSERVQLDIRREDTIATSIVSRLIDGPGVSHTRLSGLFPRGTKLISVRGEETTAFVTLSRDFLGKPDGAPADWEDIPAWQEEAALRRRLAVQSIVLSLTEDARYQRVQLYIADSDDDIPERVEMAWFDTGVTEKALVLAACSRDEQAMLTPHQAMDMILSAWQKKDWHLLYQLLAPQKGAVLPTQSVFETQMQEMGVSLLNYEATQGSVSFDGQTATIVVTAQIRTNDGGDAYIERESVPLVREQDNWAIREDALYGLLIRD